VESDIFKRWVAAFTNGRKGDPLPCVSDGCWNQTLKDKALCATCEMLYIAEHGSQSPPCDGTEDWSKIYNAKVTEELKKWRESELRRAAAVLRDPTGETIG
jgi:hypothetical protein